MNPRRLSVLILGASLLLAFDADAGQVLCQNSKKVVKIRANSCRSGEKQRAAFADAVAVENLATVVDSNTAAISSLETNLHLTASVGNSSGSNVDTDLVGTQDVASVHVISEGAGGAFWAVGTVSIYQDAGDDPLDPPLAGCSISTESGVMDDSQEVLSSGFAGQVHWSSLTAQGFYKFAGDKPGDFTVHLVCANYKDGEGPTRYADPRLTMITVPAFVASGP